MNKSLCTLRPLLFGLAIVLGGTPLFAQNALLDSIQVMGGSGFDNVVSITPDHAGNLFVLGTTQSSDFPATATFGNRPANSSNNSGDTFVSKIRLADWSLIWSAVIRPSVPLALALDDSGAVYLTGWTDSPANFPAATRGFGATSSGEPLFVLKLDATGSRIVFSAFLAPYQIYTVAPIAVDSQGQVYVAAVGSGPITPGALFPALTFGSPGAYLAKLSADGSKVIFSTYLATSATMAPNAIAVDDQQSIFVAGRDNDYYSAFPATPGVIQTKHAGSDDAFVMKFRADGSKIEFATLLGGAGGDSANFLWLGSDGSIYVAGYCEYGSPASANAPFPTTPNAPFRTFSMFQGFVARLSPDASSLLFSTYVSKDATTGVTGFAMSGGQVYAAYPTTISRALVELNYNGTTNLQSTAVQAFDANTGAASVSALQLPALTPGGFAISGTNLVIASNRSQISLPVPSTIHSIGPLDASSTPAILQSDITFGKFDLAGTPDHDIDTDRGDLYFEVYPGATPQQTLNITSSAGSVPFQLFAPSWAASAVSSRGGLTPAAVSVTPFPSNPATSGTVPALLLVSPRAVPSIQILPVLTDNLSVRVSVQADTIVLPANGGPATGTIRITANAVSPVTLASIPVSVPFLFNTVLPDLAFDTLSGTTPATINVTGQLDSLPAGRASVEQLNLTVGGQRQTVLVVLSRPGPPPLVSPTSLQLGGPLSQGSATGRVQVSPPDDATAFQVLSIPPGISVSPRAGTGSAVLAVTADLTQFPAGTTPVTFSVQVGSTQVSVTASVTVIQYPLYVGQGPLNAAPGLRLKLNASGVPVNLPRTGAWADVSPAPSNWNGYTFVYRAHTLPILSADPSLLQFDVQLPYDLDLTGSHAPIIFVAPDGTEISRGSTSGSEIAAAVALFNRGNGLNTGNGSAPVLKQDGSAVSSTNTVSPGDTVRLFVVGTGVTNPPIQPGLLPDPASTVSPVAQVQVQIGGKPATVVRQALDPKFIGVTDLDVQVPNLASGLEWLGLQTGPERVYLIQIWVAAPVAPSGNLPVITGVSNAAGGQPGVFPGSFISIFGANLTPVSDGWSNSIANGQLPTQLDGVRVTIGGKPAYIAQMIPTQINALVPDIGVGPMQVVVTTPTGSSSAYTLNSQQYGPAFWPWPGSQPVSTHADYTIAAKNGTFPGTTTAPAKSGEVITLWGTGFGPVAPAVPAGQVPGQYAGAMTTNPVSVSLNGTSVTVLGAALSEYPGDYQVAIQVPASIPSGDYTLAATIGGVSTPTMLFTVQQ